MPYTYTSDEGRQYYLRKDVPKSDEPGYAFIQIPEGGFVEGLPEGYEIREDAEGVPYLRQAEPEEPPAKLDGKKDRKGQWIALAGVIVAILTLLFGRNIVQQWQEAELQKQPPSFVVSAINTLHDKNQYEITDYWIGANPIPGIELSWGLEVFPTYHGKSLGEVQVRVTGSREQVLAGNRWTDFREPDRLPVSLDPYLLASEVSYLAVEYREEGGGYIYPIVELPIEIFRTSNPSTLLYSDTLTILNTPWYHFAKVSNSFMWGQQTSVDVYIEGHNLGGPSQFTAVAEVYEITDVSGKPFYPWPKIGWAEVPIDRVIGQDEGFSARMSLPDEADPSHLFSFEPGKCYSIETYVCKKQNYADFGQLGWQGSSEIWRFADRGDFTLVCFPTQ